MSPLPRKIDHLVLPVADLAVARQRHEALGFTVAPDAHHPFGTAIACVFFSDGTYLEPLVSADPATIAQANLGGNVFTQRQTSFIEEVGEGFSAVVLETQDAQADHRHFVAADLSAGPMREFGRVFQMPDGRQSEARFLLAFAGLADAPHFFAFACERTVPPPADRGALERHANGVTGLAAVGVAFRGGSARDWLRFISGSEALAGGPRFANLGIEAVSASDPDGLSGQLLGASVSFATRSLEVTQRLLAANGVAAEIRGGRLTVAPAPGQGVPYHFEELP